MKHKLSLKRLLTLTVVWAMCLTLTLPAAAAETAATVQVAETQGTVSVSNSRGRSLTLSENMRLYNGYQVTTEESSYAWLNLDDSKLAKQDAASVVEVRKDGKKLELLVSSGNLYFNVTKPLDSDETMNIRTSSMVTGVRGTCGWVEAVDSGHTQVYVLEGTLECQVTDPVSGQSKTASIHGGEVGNFYVYTQAQNGEYCGVTTEKFNEDAINGFVLTELAGDSALCGKIQSASGLNVRAAAGSARSRLAADEAAMNQKLDEARQQAAGQAGSVSRDPVWNGSGGESVEQPASASAEQLGAQLAQAGVSEVTVAGSSGAPETFTVDKPLEVPAGKTLTLGDNVNLVVQKGASLNVAGTLHASGDLTNNGAIDVTSGNTLRVEGQLINGAGSTIDNHANGRIVATGGILNAGTIINRDNARIVSEGMATVRMQSGGTLRFSGGAIVNEGGGYALLREGTMTPAEARTVLSSAGSGTFRARTGNVLGAVDASGVYTTVNPSGYSAQLQSDGYYRVAQGGGASQSQSSGGGTVYVNSTYTLTFDPGEGTMENGVPTREGYTFNGWANSTGQPFGSTASVSSNMTFYAQWVRNSQGGGDTPAATYNISYDANGGTLSAQGSAPTREGYTFMGWSPARDGSAPYPTTITGDITLYAQWRQNSSETAPDHTITFELDGGTMGANGVPVKSGYVFAGWSAQGAGGIVDNTLTVTGNIVLTAQWTEGSAADGRALVVTGGVEGTDYTYSDDGLLTVMSETPLIIKNRDANTPTTDRIQVNAGIDANITLAGVNIDVSTRERTAAFKIEDDSTGNVTVTLAAGTINKLTSGDYCAGLQKNGSGANIGNLTIGGSGTLTAIGSNRGAGIGGGSSGCGSNINISGGAVQAVGGYYSAGIGGGGVGFGNNITVSGGTVTATGGFCGAGIGDGFHGNGRGITINGGTVTATGGSGAAGIGGSASGGNGRAITISGGTVTANGSGNGAGIGGGNNNYGSYITISGGTVTANGDGSGAGIGGGSNGYGRNITISGGTVTANGGNGGNGAGIGSGNGKNASSITVSGGTITATGKSDGENIGGDSRAWTTVEADAGTGEKTYQVTVEGGFTYKGGTINATE